MKKTDCKKIEDWVPKKGSYILLAAGEKLHLCLYGVVVVKQELRRKSSTLCLTV